jgi:hypothetical protein
VSGWTSAELASLRALSADELATRLRVLPSELVRAGSASDLQRLAPTAGRFEIEGEEVLFRPRFPFLLGCGYALVARNVHPDRRGEADEIAFIEPPPVPAGTASVIGIFPSAAELPLNNLKIYVQFSRPMSEGWASRSIEIRDGGGVPIEGVFLGGEELWDRRHSRLTLLLEPGRIKRGLAPNQEAGPPLTEGRPVVVAIDANFPDARGRRLRAGKQRRYRIGPAERRRVDPAIWRPRWPAAESREPAIVRFDRPLDRALLGHCLEVADAGGASVAGHASIGRGERSWRFVPSAPWIAGGYSLLVDTRLEDLAGNSLLRLFDRDLTRPDDAPVEMEVAQIKFQCVLKRD